MRVLTLLGQLLIAVASGGALAWWLGTGLMRVLVRQLERRRPLREGPLWACRIVLLLPALVLALLAAWIAWALYHALAYAPEAVGLWPHHWSGSAWRIVVGAAAALIAGAGAWAAFREAFVALGGATRLRYLTDHTSVSQAHSDVHQRASEPAKGRSIVIFCDGTGNRPDQQEEGETAVTNVRKLYRALGCDETQVTWYQPGVGSDTSSTADEVRRTRAVLDAVGANPGSQVAALWARLVKLWESAFGSGIGETITNGYAEVVRQYRPGDRIYLVGFSRGAYAARCIAGVISRCGLLRAENLRYAPDMVRLYRTRKSQHDYVTVRPDLVHTDPAIHFLGVFDTVASLGVPLWGWWFRAFGLWKNQALATDPARACRHVYHALSMDERRSQFFPTLFERPTGARGPNDRLETLEQVWFRGAHADVGGGYSRHDLSDIPLGWMMDAMEKHGLRFQPYARAALKADPLGRLHDELGRRPSWILFGSWPRWHPVPSEDADMRGTTLHPSVLERAAAVQARIGRPDLLRLAPEAFIDFTVEARRDWDRTGIVIETGVTYRLTYLGQTWRDAETPPCGPAGQHAQGSFDIRRWLTSGRRMREQPWMRLVATVAHPRDWLLKEKGAGDLLKLLFRNDPAELLSQLAPIGQDLEIPGSSIFLRSDAPSGLLHMFANDWWQTASNNSGGIRLKVAREIEKTGNFPFWHLSEENLWRRTPRAH